MKTEECFYYPHNIDFRGRAYPMHPHLNHLGSDVCRGLLNFAEGRPLKGTGFRWLKIHLANLYGNGVDKLSYNDRVAFVDGNMENILDSARRPLEGSRWWLAAEDPFQSLATCMEISDALASPNVEEFISHIPVHQVGLFGHNISYFSCACVVSSLHSATDQCFLKERQDFCHSFLSKPIVSLLRKASCELNAITICHRMALAMACNIMLLSEGTL